MKAIVQRVTQASVTGTVLCQSLKNIVLLSSLVLRILKIVCGTSLTCGVLFVILDLCGSKLKHLKMHYLQVAFTIIIKEAILTHRIL